MPNREFNCVERNPESSFIRDEGGLTTTTVVGRSENLPVPSATCAGLGTTDTDSAVESGGTASASEVMRGERAIPMLQNRFVIMVVEIGKKEWAKKIQKFGKKCASHGTARGPLFDCFLG